MPPGADNRIKGCEKLRQGRDRTVTEAVIEGK